MGVWNKYCQACTRGIVEKEHTCFRKRSASLSETLFCRAEQVHRVHHIQFIGDGDSSVQPTLLQSNPGWGHTIRELECAHHACKYHQGALECLVKHNPSATILEII